MIFLRLLFVQARSAICTASAAIFETDRRSSTQMSGIPRNQTVGIADLHCLTKR